MTSPQKQTHQGHNNPRQREHPVFKYFIRTGFLIKIFSAFVLMYLLYYYV
jgi:hypothetical protein